MASTADLVALLDHLLGPGSEEVVPAPEVRRLALALDPPTSIGDADAVLLHRSWGYDPPPGVGVVACHDPFDRALGLAHNTRLHADLGLTRTEMLGPKLSVHDAPPDLVERATALFGGHERHERGDGRPLRRAAFADAMTADMVVQASRAGAELYVTGTWRVPATVAVEHSGIRVLAVGHARQERASLTRLAALLVQHAFAADIRMR